MLFYHGHGRAATSPLIPRQNHARLPISHGSWIDRALLGGSHTGPLI